MGASDRDVTGPAPAMTKHQQVELNTKVSVEARDRKFWRCLPAPTQRWECPAFTGGSW
jgi:hypothetical protein